MTLLELLEVTKVSHVLWIIAGWAAVVQCINGVEMASTVREDGRFYEYSESDGDLVNIPEKRTLDVWVNVYENGAIGFGWATKEECALPDTPAIARVHIQQEFVVGEGIDGNA